MIEQLLLIFSILSIEIYLYVVRCVNGGLLPSVSEAWYLMQKKGCDKKWFTLSLWGFSGPICYLSAYNEHWIMFTSASLICLVAVMPAFKLNFYNKFVHYFGAFIGAPLSLIALWLDFGVPLYAYFVVCILAFSVIKFHPNKFKLIWADNRYWLMEVVIIRGVYAYLFFESIVFHVFKNLF